MLDGFVSNSVPTGVMLTSYKKPTIFKKDYQGEEWVGRSHESTAPGIVRHSLKRIKSECTTRDLVACEINDPAYNFGSQTWIRVAHA